MTRVLLDTNTIAALLAGEAPAYRRLAAAVRDNRRILLSPVVDYEVRRGFLRAEKLQLRERYDGLLPRMLYLDVTREIWQKAAELWAYSRDRGRPLPDADLLIAAHALVEKADLATNDTRDFQIFTTAGLTLENWSTG